MWFQRRNQITLKTMLLVACLWASVIASALAVVFLAYDTRVKFNELEILRREKNGLQVEWGQYLLEESTWAAYSRVEKIAIEKLGMQVPKPDHIIMVKPR